MKFRFALAVALAGLALAACGSSTDPAKPDAAAAAGPTAKKADPAELSAWADKVCDVQKTALAPGKPSVPIFTNAAAADKFKTTFIESMTKAAQGNDKTVADLAALKNGPSPDSGKLIDHQSGKLKEYKAKLDETIAKVRAMKIDDVAQFNTDLIKIHSALGTDTSTVRHIVPKTVEEDLADAYRTAPNCKAVP